jgi:hypothetical protein
MYAKAKTQGLANSFELRFVRKPAGVHPFFFAWPANKDLKKSQKHIYVYTIELFVLCLCAILDRGPSAENEFAVNVSHLVLIVGDWVKWEKLRWHCW